MLLKMTSEPTKFFTTPELWREICSMKCVHSSSLPLYSIWEIFRYWEGRRAGKSFWNLNIVCPRTYHNCILLGEEWLNNIRNNKWEFSYFDLIDITQRILIEKFLVLGQDKIADLTCSTQYLPQKNQRNTKDDLPLAINSQVFGLPVLGKSAVFKGLPKSRDWCSTI